MADFRQLLAAAAAMTVLYTVQLVLYRIFFHPLSKFPGPWYYALSSLPLFYENNTRGVFFKTVKTLHERYGSIVRVAPNKLSVDGSVGWTDVYGHKKQGQSEFPRDRNFFPTFEVNNGIVSADQHNHRRMRRLLSHAFSDSALCAQEPILTAYIDLLIVQLKARQDQTVDIAKWYNFTTFDLIGDLAFGDPFHCLDTGETHPWVSAITDNIRTISRLRVFTEYPILKPLRSLLLTKESRRKRAEHHEFMRLKAQKRIDAGADTRNDFMSYILCHNDERGMTKPEIIRNSGTLVVAGSETTASALSGLTYYLLRNPRVHAKLVRHIRGAFSRDEDINLTAVKKIDYLTACLEEVLRLYPPVVETPGRLSPGDVINGQFVPKGTELTIWQYSTNHSSSSFHLPESFIPERWLPRTHPDQLQPSTDNLDPDSFAGDNLSAAQPFATGPRNCLGKNLAYAEMRLIAARVWWNFDMELEKQSNGWAEGQKVWINFWRRPLMVKLIERQE